MTLRHLFLFWGILTVFLTVLMTVFLQQNTDSVAIPCDVYVHMTRSQLELKRARCKISNKGYLSLNIWVMFYHSMVIRSWDITAIPKGLSETLFGRF